MQTVYEAVGGADGVMRLAAYWAEALGGPMTYSDSYGDETSVVRVHSGNGPHQEMEVHRDGLEHE